MQSKAFSSHNFVSRRCRYCTKLERELCRCLGTLVYLRLLPAALLQTKEDERTMRCRRRAAVAPPSARRPTNRANQHQTSDKASLS